MEKLRQRNEAQRTRVLASIKWHFEQNPVVDCRLASKIALSAQAPEGVVLSVFGVLAAHGQVRLVHSKVRGGRLMEVGEDEAKDLLFRATIQKDEVAAAEYKTIIREWHAMH